MKKLKGQLLKLRFKKDYEGNWFLFTKNDEIATNYYDVDGDIYTEKQIDDAMCDGVIFYCEDCGEYHYNDNSYYIEDIDRCVCANCIDNYYYCENCGNYYTRDSMTYIEDLGEYVCENCINNGGYDICEGCGCWFTNESLYYNENDGCYYCDNCYEEDDGNIYQYHNFSNWALYKENENDNDFYIGYELEIDNGEDEKNASDTVYENLNAVCMRDGSLYDGFEIVSHPQTYQYIMNHKESIKDTMQKLVNYGYESHNAKTCGLHFHVTAPRENRHEIVSRLWAVIEFYKNEVVKLSRRSNEQLHWCKWLSDNSDLKSIEYYHIKGMSKDYTRYLAINDTNSKTIEFRFFRGTLRYETFMAAVQFIHNLYTLASNLDIKLQDITWDKLIEGEYIRQYATEHDILTNDVIIDNYDAISKYDFNIQYFYKRIIKMLEKKEREWYKKSLQALENNTDLTDIASRIEYINAHTKVKDINESKKFFASKDYKKALETISGDILDYSVYYKNGSKDIMQFFNTCLENIDKLEGVILCA